MSSITNGTSHNTTTPPSNVTLSNLRLEFAPGERFKYSNMAFEILGDVIVKTSCESFEDYVQHHILTPLGMKNSTLLVKQADLARHRIARFIQLVSPRE